MPWPIHVNRTVVIRKRIRASKSEVSKIVSDGESYLRLQPFVNEIAQDTSNPRQYRITERVPAPFGLWMFQNSFSVMFDPVEDQNGQGINMSANLDRSSLCPELKSMIRVKETEEPGVVEVVEIMELQALSLLAPYITGLLKQAHLSLVESLAERAERRAEIGESEPVPG